MVWFFKKSALQPEVQLSSRETKSGGSETRPAKPRKEPPKPWGRKERILIGTILAATVIAGILSLISSQGGLSLPNLTLEVPSTTIELEK